MFLGYSKHFPKLGVSIRCLLFLGLPSYYRRMNSLLSFKSQIKFYFLIFFITSPNMAPSYFWSYQPYSSERLPEVFLVTKFLYLLLGTDFFTIVFLSLLLSYLCWQAQLQWLSQTNIRGGLI